MNTEQPISTVQPAPVVVPETPIVTVIGNDTSAAKALAVKLSRAYPLDWKTIDVALAEGRYVHTLERPDNELILERESDINHDITIDKKGGYLLPDPTELEELDAKNYDRLNPRASGYSEEIPELHKATAFQGLFERNIYIAEGCDVYGDEIVVIEEVGNGLEPDFVIEHVLRGADEAEVKRFRRKNNSRKSNVIGAGGRNSCSLHSFARQWSFTKLCSKE